MTHLAVHSQMVAVTIVSVGKPPAVARGLPFTVEITGKSAGEVTIADVKSALSAKFPKVHSHYFGAF